MNKRGVLEDLQKLVVPLVGVGIVLVIGFLIISEANTQIIDNNPCQNQSNIYNSTGKCCYTIGSTCDGGGGLSHAINSTKQVQNALADLPQWLPIIVITIIGALLIGLVAVFRRLGK
jgi:amino acid transporter